MKIFSNPTIKINNNINNNNYKIIWADELLKIMTNLTSTLALKTKHTKRLAEFAKDWEKVFE